MEQRAVVILFTGNEVQEGTLAKICQIISQSAFSHPEDVQISTFDEDDLAKLLAKSIVHNHSKKPTTAKNTESAVTMLSKEFPIGNNVALTIHLGRAIPEIYGRIKYGKAIQHDVDTVENIKLILKDDANTFNIIKSLGGNQETIKVIRKIFNTYFDEKGNVR